MFRITSNFDDAFHPLQGDVRTVASVAEALAAMGGIFPDCDESAEALLGELMLTGGAEYFYGAGVEFKVERV